MRSISLSAARFIALSALPRQEDSWASTPTRANGAAAKGMFDVGHALPIGRLINRGSSGLLVLRGEPRMTQRG